MPFCCRRKVFGTIKGILTRTGSVFISIFWWTFSLTHSKTWNSITSYVYCRTVNLFHYKTSRTSMEHNFMRRQKFFAAETLGKMLRLRMIPSDYCQPLGHVVVKEDRVIIVSGESGCGKTFSAIMDCMKYDILYLTPDDLGWNDSTGWNREVERKYASKTTLTTSEGIARNKVAKNAIISAVEEMNFLNESKVHPFKAAESKRGITLIIDEVGAIPHFVRAVMSGRSN
eukprot:PhF_6_TR22654/c0_g1_i2/m.32275